MKFWGNGIQGAAADGCDGRARWGPAAAAMKAAIDRGQPERVHPAGRVPQRRRTILQGAGAHQRQHLHEPDPARVPAELHHPGLRRPPERQRGRPGRQATISNSPDPATNDRFVELVRGNAERHRPHRRLRLWRVMGDAAANDVLRTAATNGGGQFYNANNSAELEAALQDAIRRIIAATFTFATPVVPTTSTTGSTKAYLAAFQSDPSRPFWKGYLKAYQRDSNGLVPIDGNGVPLSSALVWEAGQVLSTTASSSRTIKTVPADQCRLRLHDRGTGSLTSLDKGNSDDHAGSAGRREQHRAGPDHRLRSRRRHPRRGQGRQHYRGSGAGNSATSSIRRPSSSRRRSWR